MSQMVTLLQECPDKVVLWVERIVAKLSKFETSVVTIMETKWFGSAL